ncbi:MAG: cytochrome o ubiquinol oxidase subunit IV [Parachlamydiaceae bacterium]
MHTDLSLKEMQKEWHGTLRSYIIGFVASIVLTSTSFFLVIAKNIPEFLLVYVIVGLALTQAIFQLLFFLHVGQEAKPRWETIVFCFMLLILFIIVIGSLWIMYDLDNRVMSNMSNMMGAIFHD